MDTAILFDLDGTLLDTLADLADSTNAALTQLGYPRRTLEEVRRFVGNGARRLMEQAVPAGGDADAAYNAFRAYYDAHSQIKTAPYPGILAALKKIQEKHPVAIVSNKPDSAVKILCRQHFPGIYARGESPDCPRKPAPDMVFMAMHSLGCDRCIYVGDSEVDVRTAKNAGVPCLSVLWGFRGKEQIEAAGGTVFCAAPGELPDKIEEMIHGQ